MYKVIKAFTDLQDDNHVYHVGDSFPRNGKEVSAKRLEELSTAKNRRGIPLIEEIKEAKVEKEEEVEVAKEEATSDGSKVDEEAPKKRSRKKKDNVENVD